MSIQQNKIKAIIQKIWSLLPNPQPMSGDDIVDKIDDVYKAGKQAEKEDFWDKFQNNGNRTDYGYGFAGVGWTDENYNPKYPIRVTSTASIYQYSRITITKQPIIIQTTAANNSPFYACQFLEEITELVLETDVSNASSAFSNCSSLTTVRITGSGKFLGSLNLRNSSYLTPESIRNFIEALSPDVSGQTITFKKSCLKAAFGIEISSDAEIPTDNDFYTLRQSRRNWVFAYVT